MLYTPSHAELAQHPKTRKLARLLGVSIPTALGHLHLLWHFALKYAQDGDLARFDCDEIADGCLWEGGGERFTGALIEAGWLDMATDGATAIHDWDEHGGKAIRREEARMGRLGEEYRAWRKAVLVRDHFTCQGEACFSQDDLHAHHIKRYATHPELRLDVNNGITLCGDCHRALHAREGYR